MGIFDIVRSLMPGNDRTDRRTRDRNPTREPEPDTGSEAAVKGTDDRATSTGDEPAAAGTDAAASTGSLTEEPPETPGDDEVAAAAEPAEAAGPATQVDEGDAGSDQADEPESGPTAGEETGSTDLESVSGIGEAYANRLRGAGVDDVEALLEADAAALAEETGVGEARIQRWQERAGAS